MMESQTFHFPDDDVTCSSLTIQETIEVKLDERSVLNRIAQNESANRQLLRAFLHGSTPKKLRKHWPRVSHKLTRIAEESSSQDESSLVDETRSEHEVDTRLSVIAEGGDARDDQSQSHSQYLFALFREGDLEFDAREEPQHSDITESEFDDDEWSEMAQRSLPELPSYESINLFESNVENENDSPIKEEASLVSKNDAGVQEEVPTVDEEEQKEPSLVSGESTHVSTVLTHVISHQEEEEVVVEESDDVRPSRQELLAGCMGARPSSHRQHASVRRAKGHHARRAPIKSIMFENEPDSDKVELPIKKERDVPIEDDPCGAMAHILTIEVEVEEKKKPLIVDDAADMKRSRQELLTGCIGARPARTHSSSRRIKTSPPTYKSIEKMPKVCSTHSSKDRERHRVRFADSVALISCGIPGMYRASHDSTSMTDESSCHHDTKPPSRDKKNAQDSMTDESSCHHDTKPPSRDEKNVIHGSPSIPSNTFYHFFVWEDDEDIYTYDDTYEGVVDEFYYEGSVGSITDMSSRE